ncbi:hypothetical protein [Variovorax soli]|uniref:Uncharacterized protein n=1 Tax=Variovorax soli TaxID=376815 RepID=A0ABU1NMS0_9BURK|nr:hypothetical protein [Variovorax soli]MDR6539719.1 hypothetical protein [Variovorax soli]
MSQDVSPSDADRARSVVSEHPLWAEASAHAYCKSDIFGSQKSLIERARLTDEERVVLRAALADADSVLVVSYFTADKTPEPLSGGGKLYGFLVHPHTFELLHAGEGTWRS